MEEGTLITGLRARDKRTVEYLYDHYSRALFAVISRIISDKDIAEEIFHDAFVKITRKIDSFDESKGRLYTWMANICRNAAIDKSRSKEISENRRTNSIDDFVYGMVSQSGAFEKVEGIGGRKLFPWLNSILKPGRN